MNVFSIFFILILLGKAGPIPNLPIFSFLLRGNRKENLECCCNQLNQPIYHFPFTKKVKQINNKKIQYSISNNLSFTMALIMVFITYLS